MGIGIVEGLHWYHAGTEAWCDDYKDDDNLASRHRSRPTDIQTQINTDNTRSKSWGGDVCNRITRSCTIGWAGDTLMMTYTSRSLRDLVKYSLVVSHAQNDVSGRAEELVIKKYVNTLSSRNMLPK